MIWAGVLIGAYTFGAGVVFAELFSLARDADWKDAVVSLVVGVLWLPIIVLGLICLVVVGDGDLT